MFWKEWRERRTAQRLRAVQLEHKHWISTTAIQAIRIVLVCADRQRQQGKDTHELFTTVGLIIDLWERDTSAEAWENMLRTLRANGGMSP